PDFVDRENVWMVQVRSRGRFLFKTMETILVGRIFLAQDLDRDFAPELHVFGKIDLAHPARAELLEDSVMRNFTAVHAQLWCLMLTPQSVFQVRLRRSLVSRARVHH